MKLRTTFGWVLPSLTVLAASLQAADVSPVWVEYPSTSPAPASRTEKTLPAAAATPAATTPASAPAASSTAPVVAAPPPATQTAPAAPQLSAAPVSTMTPPLAAAPVQTPAPANGNGNGNGAQQTPTAPVVTAVITPRLFLFDYFKGVGEDKTHFLERYDYREGFSSDTRTDVFADVDLDLTISNADRDLFVLERQGFGQHNHRGKAKFSDDEIAFSAQYSHYRSATGGIDFLFSPNEVAVGTVPGGPYQTFNDDAGRFDYHVDRTSYGASFKVKPTLLGGVAAVSIDYDGYMREGNKFAPFYLDNPATCPGSGPCITNDADKWRGINLGIDERMNKVAFNIDASPKGLFNINYNVSLEKFTSGTADLKLFDDILSPQGVAVTDITSTNRRGLAPFFYVPDTSLVSQTLQLNQRFGHTFLLALGYSHSSLEDDSSHPRFTALFGGPPPGLPDSWEGEITTDSAFLNASWNARSNLGVEGFVKYYQRDNGSSFPVENVISPTAPGQLVAPRINDITSIDYGLAANWRPGVMGSTVTLGWHRLDRERDLTFGAAAAEHILPGQTLYREDTLSDEAYLKLIARPAKGWNIRLTPSYTWADKTGLVSEPEEALQVKSLVSYTAPAGWLASGFYDYTRKQNANNTFLDAGGPGLTYSQDIDSTLHSAGLTFNVMPVDTVNAFANLFWVQNDLSSYLFQTNTERWNPGVIFSLIDRPNYKVDTYSLGIGADWQARDKLKLRGSYTFSKSTGDVATGVVLTELQNATGTIDSKIDNTLHSISFGADYSLTPKAKLRANYLYDYYDDDAYSLLNGGVHMLSIGVSFKM